jgi:hypothetical protein
MLDMELKHCTYRYITIPYHSLELHLLFVSTFF